MLTFHQRRERQLFVSQWFLFAALFWFPWIYSTANLLLLAFPVRGMAQAVILVVFRCNLWWSGSGWLAWPRSSISCPSSPAANCTAAISPC